MRERTLVDFVLRRQKWEKRMMGQFEERKSVNVQTWRKRGYLWGLAS